MISRILCTALAAFALPGYAQRADDKAAGKWTPPSLAEVRSALDAPGSDKSEAAKLVYKLFGRQNLAMGKAGVKIDGTDAAWAVQNSSPARVVDAAGKVIGDMKRLTDDGLQAVIVTMPNFIEFDYRIESGGIALMAGKAHIEHYPIPPEALPQPGIPEGRLEKFEWKSAKVFPDTLRTVTVYVPAQYDAQKPPCLMVWQDGSRHADPNGQMRATRVFDTLISKGDMPPTIGVFIDPGRRLNQKPGDKAANRGFEYDSLGDAYSRFVIDEVLPEVKQRYSLTWSDKPEDHAIAGGSSGGICAFTVAWERPDQFRKVLSWVGSFVNLRGGHVYPAMIRETERKPLRVYLLDGDNDLDNPFGNWPIANQNMAAALKYMGYDYRFDFGHCFHGSKGMSASLPDALRWLWRKS